MARRIRKGPSRSSRIRSDEAKGVSVDEPADVSEALPSALPGNGDDEVFGPDPLDAAVHHGHATYTGTHTDGYARGVVAHANWGI